MPTTIWDSSLITYRKRQLAVSGSFIPRITNPVNPNTGYAPLLGIYDNSIIPIVKKGSMTFFRKTEGGTIGVGFGTPCTPPPVNSIGPNVVFPSVPNVNISLGNMPNASGPVPLPL